MKEQASIIPWVFHGNGRPIKHFRRSWLTACRHAGLPDKRPHDIRRTAVRNLDRAGVSQTRAMALVGHKTPAIYKRYNITSEQDLQDTGAKLDLLSQGTQTGPRRLQLDARSSPTDHDGTGPFYAALYPG